MRKVIILCMLVVFAQPVVAKLYKCKDADGNTAYTDEPCLDGKEIKLPPLHTYTPAVATPSSPETIGGVQVFKGYKSLSITEPKNDKAIISNTRAVTVSYQLKPALDTNRGHKYSIALDGKQLKAKGVTSQIKLQDVDRGSHTVQIFVLDRDSNILISSQTVTFHLRQSSVITNPEHETPFKTPQAQSIPPAQQAPRFKSPY